MDSPLVLDRVVHNDGLTSPAMLKRQEKHRKKVGKEVLRERVNRSQRKIRQERPTEVRAYERELNLRNRVSALMFLGGMCERCKNNDMRVLQIDHVNGGGSKENKTIHSRGVALRAMQNPSEYQILCANCNWIKRWERNENKPRKDDP